MKKYTIIIFLVILSLISFGSFFVFAVDSSPEAVLTPSQSTEEDKDIQELKERVANKVAEIRKKDQKALSGYANVKDGKISLKDTEDMEYTVTIDESLSKVYRISGSTKKEIKPSDIKTDTYMIVTGPVVDKSVSANFIFVDDVYIVQSGKVMEINKEDYYIKIMSQDKEEYILDIETSTKQNMLNMKTLEIEKSGFSKIKEGDTAHFTAINSKTEKNSSNRFTAQKILVIPQEYFMK
ncbi:MAG: hypothetical protein WC489_02960 [Patescibacteria group bacterium]